jgi:hypothetical protein
VESNFVLLDPAPLGLTVGETIARLDAEGVRLSRAAAPGMLRAVTHLDVSAADVERAVAGAARALAGVAA